MASVAGVRPARAGPPFHLTRLVGRASELGRVRRLLGEHRLVSLTGVGGVGKTRLAVEALGHPSTCPGARRVWVDVAAVREPLVLPAHVRHALAHSPDPPPGSAVPVAGGRATMVPPAAGDPATLLVLDGCEHLLGVCAMVALELLGEDPDLRILATTREALGVPGERPFVVPPLATPPPAHWTTAAAILGSPSVELFVERALAVAPALRIDDASAVTVADICRRLDGLPLAIELAAARTSVLGLRQIAERLADRFRLLTAGGRLSDGRHRTLRATLDWSLETLSTDERLLLDRLGAFCCGFSLDAVEQVCAADGRPPDVLSTLGALAHKSLVVVERTADGGSRYRMLETVREWALERLRGDPDGARIRDRHADHFRTLARSALAGPGSDPAVPATHDALEPDLGNLQVAAAWCDERGGSSSELRSCLAVLERRPAAHPGPETAPARLVVRALGGLQVTLDGEPFDPRRWRGMRARELVLYLLCHPEGRGREDIGRALWPDTPAGRLRNNVNITVHRLRCALGGHEWVRRDGARYRMDEPSCAFDVATFEREVGAALGAPRTDGSTARLEAALALYRGPFLDGLPAGAWHVAIRERLERSYRHALEELERRRTPVSAG